MSSGCGDVLSLVDLQTAKKHQIFEAEVITGKAGGVATGADIDYATNQVTGQTQKTLPAVLRDAGFRPAPFTFETGGTLGVNDADLAVLWPGPSGDGNYYAWKGALPKTIPASSTPASTGGVGQTAWVAVSEAALRRDLALSTGAGLVGTTSGRTVQAEFDYRKTQAAKTEINILDYLPANVIAALNDVNASKALGSVRTYIEQALAAATSENIGTGVTLRFPAGFFWLDSTLNLPKRTRIVGVYPETYFMALPDFTGTNVIAGSTGPAIVAIDNTGQDPFYIEGFQINADGSQPNVVGLHIGGCRNSVVRRISVSGTFDAAVVIHPKNATSGAVENLELSHVWTLGGGLVLRTNTDIDRGNLTGLSFRDCMFFSTIDNNPSWATSGNPSIRFSCHVDRQIFACTFDRVGWASRATYAIYSESLAGNSASDVKGFRDIHFTDFHGEAHNADGSLTADCTFALLANMRNSTFTNIQRSGAVTRGGIIMDGCEYVTFNSVSFANPNITTGTTTPCCVYQNSTNRFNRFINCDLTDATGSMFDLAGWTVSSSVMYYFKGLFWDDSGTSTWESEQMSSKPFVLFKRSALNANNGSAYPQESGVTMATSGDNLQVTFARDATTKTFTIPITTTNAVFNNHDRVYVLFRHQFTSYGTNTVVKIGLGTSYVTISPQTGNDYFAAISLARSQATSFNIQVTYSGASADCGILIRDLVISDRMPWVPNFTKSLLCD
ncbi:TPA: hypothetical protein P1L80_004365 [Escherichia coli]|nr:hypothetical protein [Escherichia coli]